MKHFTFPYRLVLYWHKCGIQQFIYGSLRFNKKSLKNRLKLIERTRQFNNFLDKHFLDWCIHTHEEFIPGKFYDLFYLNEEFEKYRKEVLKYGS